jgi:Tfp pilus assembly protein PilF/predicted aspartyl protease
LILFARLPRRARPLLALVCASLVFVLPAPTGAQRATKSIAADAGRLFTEGKFARARDVYAQALKSAPGDAGLHEGLSLALSRLDNWPQALVEAQKAVADAPQSADAHGLLALSLLRAGQTVGAGRETARALELDPKNYRGLVARGRLQLWDGQKTQARDTLRQAITLHPDDPDAWFYIVDAFEDDVTDELLNDIDAYAALKPKGHPHDLAMESLPTLRPYLTHFAGDSPYHADAPVSEEQLKTADAGDATPFTFSTPFELSGDYVALPIVLNDQKMRVLFDTGGGFSIALNKKASEKLNLPSLGKSFVRGVSGREASMEAKADTMTVGTETFRAIPIDILSGDTGEEDGVFGVSNFDHYAVTIDFAAKNLTLARGKTAAAPAPKPDGRVMQMPFHLLGGDIIIPITVEGREVWALVDTGADADVILSLDLARSVAAKRKPDSYATRAVSERLGLGNTVKKQTVLLFRAPVEVRVGNLDGRPFVTSISPAFGADLIDTQISPASMFQLGAIVGINFLNKAARVTFDYPHRLLTLEYAPK